MLNTNKSTHDRNVSCRVELISKAVIGAALTPATKYLFRVIIVVFAIGNRYKAGIQRTISKQSIRRQLIEMKKDYKLQGD